MDLSHTILEAIDIRSFSNLWFWIALAVMWSTASHWVIGVPWDMVIRARRQAGESLQEVEVLAVIHARRLLFIWRVSGAWLVALICAGLCFLAILGFGYRSNFCQAVFLIALPMSIVWIISLRTALRIEQGQAEGAALLRRLKVHRMCIQTCGMLSIFVTALWGMYQNLNTSVLGG